MLMLIDAGWYFPVDPENRLTTEPTVPALTAPNGFVDCVFARWDHTSPGGRRFTILGLLDTTVRECATFARQT